MHEKRTARIPGHAIHRSRASWRDRARETPPPDKADEVTSPGPLEAIATPGNAPSDLPVPALMDGEVPAPKGESVEPVKSEPVVADAPPEIDPDVQVAADATASLIEDERVATLAQAQAAAEAVSDRSLADRIRALLDRVVAEEVTDASVRKLVLEAIGETVPDSSEAT